MRGKARSSDGALGRKDGALCTYTALKTDVSDGLCAHVTPRREKKASLSLSLERERTRERERERTRESSILRFFENGLWKRGACPRWTRVFVFFPLSHEDSWGFACPLALVRTYCTTCLGDARERPALDRSILEIFKGEKCAVVSGQCRGSARRRCLRPACAIMLFFQEERKQHSETRNIHPSPPNECHT